MTEGEVGGGADGAGGRANGRAPSVVPAPPSGPPDLVAAGLHPEVPPLPPLPPEHRARQLIDAELIAAGWAVQDRRVMNLFAPEQGIAMREFVMAPGHGRVDYLLYVDRQVVGVIEARPDGISLPSGEWRSTLYAEGLPEEHRRRAVEVEGRLPFLIEASGVETYFTNGFDPEPRARRIFAVPRPRTLAGYLREAQLHPEAPTWRGRVRNLPPLDIEGLRPAQIQAIQGVDNALAEQRQDRSLIHMATGAGKTFTAVTAADRLLRHGGFRRILVLVDRNILADEMLAKFPHHSASDGHESSPFSTPYRVEKLSKASTVDECSVVISTVQRVHRALQGRDVPDLDDPGFDAYVPDARVTVGYNPELPPETFDLVILDDAHPASYGAWRPVLEYFDAHIVGITATPGGDTFAFFDRQLLAEYSYPQSVADNVNVDFDVYRIRTALTDPGALIDAGPLVPRGDRRTRVERYTEVQEGHRSLAPHVDPAVTSPSQLRTVLETFRDRLFTEIFPGRSIVPKTLIFCRDDAHAQQVVIAVRDVFGEADDFAVALTYQAEDSRLALRNFRDSAGPRVGVTADMVATGIDLTPVECLLFLRDVRSAASFEQMKGRAARTIDSGFLHTVTPDATEKTRFVVVDAIGVTEHDFVEPPLNRHRTASLEKLLGRAAALTLTEDETATLVARLSALRLQLTEQERAEIDRAAGGSLLAVVHDLLDAVDPDTQAAAVAAEPQRAPESVVGKLLQQAIRPLAENPGLRSRILKLRRSHPGGNDPSTEPLTDERGRVDTDRARSIVDAWQHFLAEQHSAIPALHLIQVDPAYRIPFAVVQQLSELIARPPYNWTPDLIWSAYEAIYPDRVRPSERRTLTDLVSLLRFSTGRTEELVSYADRVHQRYSAWLLQQERAGVPFTDDQRWWLDRMAEVIAATAGISVDDLNTAPFTERGGASGIVRDLGIDAARIIGGLNAELTA